MAMFYSGIFPMLYYIFSALAKALHDAALKAGFASKVNVWSLDLFISH